MQGITFFQDLTVVLLVAAVVTVVFHMLRQPVVLGYILAGFIIGPWSPPFPLVSDTDNIATLSQLGVVMLMFSLGLQLSFKGLMRIGPTASVAAVVEILLMIWIGYQVGRLLGWQQMDAIFLGALLLSSSTVIIVKVLNDLRCTQAPFARLIFGILVLDDMAAILAIAVLSGIALSGSFSTGELVSTGGLIGLFLTVVLVGGLIVLPWLLHRIAALRSNEVMLIVVLAIGFGVALLAVRLGLSMALGAFLIGAVIAETREGGQIRALTEPVRDLFSAIFFVSIGMLVNPQLLLEYWPAIAVVTVVLIVGKTLTGALGAFLAGYDLRTSLRVGLGLAQIGEFAFIIAVMGMELGVTSDFLFPIAVSVAAITTLTTPMLIRFSDPIAGGLLSLIPGRVRQRLDLYPRWVGSLGHAPHQPDQVRRLLRRWFMQMGLNMVLCTALFVVAVVAVPRVAPTLGMLPAWTGGPQAVLFFAALLLSMPLLIATVRKMRAASMLMSEATITRGGSREQIASLRSLMTSILTGGGVVVITLYVLLLGSAMLASWTAMLVMLVLACAVAYWRWRLFIRLYARAQGSIFETLEAIEPPQEPAPPRLDPWLLKATVQTVKLPAGAPVAGQRIGQVMLRTHTGASIVGIERAGESLVNPGPDQVLCEDDHLILLGTQEHLDAARQLLGGEVTLPHPPQEEAGRS